MFGAFSREDKDIERGMADGRSWAMGRSSEAPVSPPIMVEMDRVVFLSARDHYRKR